jgi:hypothetical protein
MVWARRGDAECYRDRAEELRTKADTFRPENHAMLLSMANFYEAFAREMEMEDAARRHLGKSEIQTETLPSAAAE